MNGGAAPTVGDAHITRHAGLVGEMAVFDVELDQRFGMFRDEGDRHHDQPDPLGAGAADLVIGRGPEPVQRPDAALIADDAVQAAPAHARGADAATVRSTCH